MSEPAAPRPSSGLVLVVDDVEDLRHLLAQALRHHGFGVLGAATGAEALAAFTHPVDAVLLDLGLPDMPGLDVLDAIRRLPHPPPVIVLTGSVDRDAPACLSRGAHDFMAKPPQLDELVARVRAAVRVKHLQDDLHSVNRLLSHQAMTDPLTGLANRRHGYAELDRLVASSHRHGRSLAVLLADIDHFKSVNDTYGHDAGDAVLREAARRLSKAVRSTDLAVRWGGEEFVGLLPDASHAYAEEVAERIRTAVADPPFATGAGSLHATVSVGWAMLSEGETGMDLVARADAALYEAKRRGRNAVVTDVA
ncbi:MAG: GGDEF domain-containing response regulator [Solirubrobacteraceae bacterium]